MSMELLQRKLLMVTGKGGIGKTLVSAALAQAAASLGKRVLVLEFGAVDQLSPLFGVQTVGHERREVQPQLFCANINPEDNFRDFVVKYLGQQKLFDKVISHRVIQTFIHTIPGLAELMMLGRLYFEGTVAPGARFDLIIFDGPASGHFLNMMTTPDAVLNSNIAGPLRKETERVRDFLAQKDQVGCLYITVPEELVMSEAIEFIPQLSSRSPAALAGVLINKVPPQWCGQQGQSREIDESNFQSDLHDLSCASMVAKIREESLRRADQALTLFDLELKKGLLSGIDTRAPGVKSPQVWHLPDLFSVREPLEPHFWKQLLGHTGGPLTSQDRGGNENGR